MPANKTNKVYGKITAHIVAKLREGVSPWSKPWAGVAGQARSINGNVYRGINAVVMGISQAAYDDPRWLTFQKAKQLGGNVKRGERGTPVVGWRWVEDEKTGQDICRGIFGYTVFNVQQCEGLNLTPVPDVAKPSPVEALEHCERTISAWFDRPTIDHGGAQAFYRPSDDHVQMPPRDSFKGSAEYYCTLFHELTHSTGHAKRLNRDGIVNCDRFGSDRYAEEELIAELGAAMLCGVHGIKCTLDNSAAYLKGWASKLGSDEQLIIRAAQAAQRAADHVCKRAKAEEGLQAA